MSNTATFSDYIAQHKQLIDDSLDQQLGRFSSTLSEHDNSQLLEKLRSAMYYSLLNGGKRIRPLLVFAAAEAIKPDIDHSQLIQLACAIEMIHSYSLVHDDLPGMDNDDLRRGQPTCHIAFDEATAILAGDALQTRAFELISQLDCPADTRIALIQTLCYAAGPQGMVGGQAIDLAAEGKTISIEHLETLHQLKTGALIRAAVSLGAQLAGASAQQCLQLDRYAAAIGLSFQVQDDILDIESDTKTLGKRQGADIALNKSTYPALLGLEAAKQKAKDLHQRALDCLTSFGPQAERLRELSHYIISRRN